MKKVSKKPKKNSAVSYPDYNLGERIKYLRTNRKLSQAQLAKMAKISQSSIAQIEVSKKDPSVQTLNNIAKALDVEIALLFASEDIFVLDLKRLRRKYNHKDKLTPHLYMALGKIIQFARDIKFIE